MQEHLSSDRLIGHHRARMDYKDSPVNTLQFAYGDQRYMKATYELLREDDELKIKTLSQLIQDFSLVENVSQALLSSDLLTVVLGHLTNTIEEIRHKSAVIMQKICATPQGRATIISRNCIEKYQRLIHDSSVPIRSQTYDGLIAFCEFSEGIEEVLAKGGILTDLVDQLVAEKTPDILVKTVELLKILMQGEVGTPLALKTEIISRLMALIEHGKEQIRYQVCMTLANLSFNEAGKAAIVHKGHIKQISTCISDPTKSVRQASTLLLCSLAQINQGKIQILDYCSFGEIEQLLAEDPPTVLNAVQLIANLAEHPHGRELATEIEGKLDAIDNIERKYIDETLEVIRWKP